VHAAVAAIEQNAGPIAVLVNNAGSLHAIGPLWEIEPSDWWDDVRTSLGGAFNFCREIAPRMVERRAGRIVNVTSYVGMRPAPYETGYACAKAALTSLTEALAASLEQHGIKVFGMAPGFTPSAMTEHLQTSDAGRRWLPNAGTGRVVDVDRSAAAITALASGAADELSGRFVHALDDLDALLEHIDEIRRDDLYVPRLRRLPGR
jgi:NAD(P)-dependent dehydrogenase (short-subunit alcohol dehydrogenase family)